MPLRKIQPLLNLLAVVLIALPTWGISDIEAPPFKKLQENTLFNGNKVIEYELKNGLRVLIVPRHEAEVVNFQMWFDVGSIHEKLDPKLKKTGLAHLFEHMMFRGTKSYPDGKFDELTARMGATEKNATTYFYRTNYFESVPSYQLDPLMALESDRMQNLNLNAELFEREKGAVVGELRRALDNPSRFANDELNKLMFKNLPFHWTVLGTEAEIKGFTLQEAQYFYQTFYAPNNATLILVGDVEEDAAIKMVDKYYGKMKNQKIPATKPLPEAPQSKERRVTKTHKQATSEILLMAYPIPPLLSQSVIPLGLIGTHLSAGMEARLRKTLVDTGIAVGFSASAGYRPDMFEFFVQMAEGKAATQALKIIDSEIAKLKTIPLTQDEFQRALSQELLDVYSSIGDNSRLGRILGEYNAICGNYMRAFQILEGYKSMTPKDLMLASREYFDSKQRNIVIVKPERQGKRK